MCEAFKRVVCACPKRFLVEELFYSHVEIVKYLLFKKKKNLINYMYNYSSMIFCILFFKIKALSVVVFFLLLCLPQS